MPKGKTVRTSALVAVAVRLRAEGLTCREIGERLGIAPSTAGEWALDPDGSKRGARKFGYRGICAVCGGPTNGDSPGKTSTRCMGCLRWDRDAILDAFRAWFDDHAIPPRTIDAHHNPLLPHDTVVVKHFGSWNNALLAAGFPLVRDRRPDVWQDVRDRVLAGAKVGDIAAERGCTASSIYQHLHRHGIRLGGRRRRWTDDAIVSAFRAWTIANGRPPSSEDWRYASDDHPATLTVVAHFGSFTAARAHALNADRSAA